MVTPRRTRLAQVALLAAGAALAFIAGTPAISSPVAAADGIAKINHVIVIYQENWSFDSLYPYYPGASSTISPSTTTRTTPRAPRRGRTTSRTSRYSSAT